MNNTRNSGAQLVPFGIMIICWNTCPSTLANILSIIFVLLYSYWQPGDGGRYYYTTWVWYMRTTWFTLYLYIRLIYVYIINFNSLHLSSISFHIAKWKTKIIHTVGTVSKSNGKIVVRRQIDTPNTQIHNVLITFLDLYNSCIGFNIFPSGIQCVWCFTISISGETYIEAGVPYMVTCNVSSFVNNRRTTYSTIISDNDRIDFYIAHSTTSGYYYEDSTNGFTVCPNSLCSCDTDGLATHWIYNTPTDLASPVTFRCV